MFCQNNLCFTTLSDDETAMGLSYRNNIQLQDRDGNAGEE